MSPPSWPAPANSCAARRAEAVYRVVMPALEMAQETGRLLRWLKAEGEPVRRGEPLMEIETDKVTLEIEAGGSGVLARVSAAPGDEVPVGQVIALLLAPGESPAAPQPSPPAAATTPPPAPTPSHAPRQRRRPGAAVAASPLARRLAAEHGVDLSAVPAPQGRISKADVLAWLQRNAPPAEAPLRASPKARRLAARRGLALETLRGSGPQGAVLAADLPPATDVPAADLPDDVLRVLPLTGMRGAIAARTQASAQTAPHISLSLSADMSAALQLQRQLAPAVEAAAGSRFTLTALLARVVAATLRSHPRLNAHLLDQEIREFRPVHLAVAVALDEGLLLPVLRDCDSLGFAQLQSRLHTLAQRARSRRLGRAELESGTFTLSNLGMFGIERFSAILQLPQVAILSVGAVQQNVVAVADAPALRPTLQLTITVDHRAVDGAVAAAFLRDLKALLEDPWSLLV